MSVVFLVPGTAGGQSPAEETTSASTTLPGDPIAVAAQAFPPETSVPPTTATTEDKDVPGTVTGSGASIGGSSAAFEGGTTTTVLPADGPAASPAEGPIPPPADDAGIIERVDGLAATPVTVSPGPASSPAFADGPGSVVDERAEPIPTPIADDESDEPVLFARTASRLTRPVSISALLLALVLLVGPSFARPRRPATP